MTGTKLPVRITRSAAALIRDGASWWSANRPKAPGAFAEDLRSAVELISHQPTIGTRAASKRLQDVRRVYLSRIRYYLYYRVHVGRIEILAVWHSSRGKEPAL